MLTTRIDELVELVLHYRTIADMYEFFDKYIGCDELGFDNTTLFTIVTFIEHELQEGISALNNFELGDFNLAADDALHELCLVYNNPGYEAIGRYYTNI